MVLAELAEIATLNLSAYVREFLAETDERDPEVLASQIVASLDLEAVRAALRCALVPFVKTMQRRITNSGWKKLGGAAGRESAPDVRPVPIRPPSRWTKDFAVAAKQFLDNTVRVGGVSKALGACSREDVEVLAAERLEQAKETAVAGNRYLLLAKVMAKQNVLVVADLPEDAILQVARWRS